MIVPATPKTLEFAAKVKAKKTKRAERFGWTKGDIVVSK